MPDEINTEESIEAKQSEAVQNLITIITRKRDEAVAFRAASGVERRWREDQELVEGSLNYPSGESSMLSYATQTAPIKNSNSPHRSMIEINVVRNKCETAIGRFCDIILPLDTRNWGLSVTPVPELEKALKDARTAKLKGTNEPLVDPNGKQVKISDIASKELMEAKEKMSGMELEIEDQLTECNYNGEVRKVICNSVNLGTGIIRGPNVVKKTYKCYKKIDGKYKLQVQEKHQPESEAVSCWDIYPDPDTTENVKATMGYVFERQDIRQRDLYNLIGVSGYDRDTILHILEQKPKRISTIINERSNKLQTMQKVSEFNDVYEMWIYYGDMDRETLQTLGKKVSDFPEGLNLSVCVVMVNDLPIKVMLNSLDSGDLPYDFFSWSPVVGSPWGIGLPRMMMWLQHMINGAMRAMMDNAGDSSGVNVVLSSEIAPIDDKYELTGKKLWRYVGEDPNEIDVRKLFAQFQVGNNQAELQNIVELAFKLLDLETGVPMIFQGEQQKLPETLGATNIMVNASNVSLRSRVKFFDDELTKPHLTKYYHWNMQYNDNDEIKGDYTVDPRGTSVLLQRDFHLKTLLQILEFKNDPDFKVNVDWDKAIKKMFEILGLDILNSTDVAMQIKKQIEENPGEDPKIQAIKIKSQADIEEANIRAKITLDEITFKEKEAELTRQHERELKLMDRDIKIMEFAEKNKISIAQVKASLFSDMAKLKTQIALTKGNGKAPQVVTPMVEPPGRAPEGEAFTK